MIWDKKAQSIILPNVDSDFHDPQSANSTQTNSDFGTPNASLVSVWFHVIDTMSVLTG